MILQDNT